MIDFLFQINKMSLALELAAVFVITASNIISVNHRARRSAFPLVVLLMCVTSISHLGIEYVSRSMWASDETLALGSLIWYLGFSVTDFIFVTLTIYACRRFSLRRDALSDFILFAFFVIGFVQIIRYTDRYILGFDVTGDFYRYLILTLNLMTTIGVCLYSAEYIRRNHTANLKVNLSLKRRG